MDNSYSGGEDALLMGTVLTVVGGIIGIAVYLYFSFTLYLIFKKMNYRSPIAAFVPIWQNYALLQAGNQKTWFLWLYLGGALLNIIPLIGQLLFLGTSVLFIIALVYSYVNINKGFSKTVTLWTALAFLVPYIWSSLLAFGSKNQYNPSLANGPYLMNKQITQQGQQGGFQQAPQQSFNQPQQYGQQPQQQQSPYGNPQQAPQQPYSNPQQQGQNNGQQQSPFGQQPQAPQQGGFPPRPPQFPKPNQQPPNNNQYGI